MSEIQQGRYDQLLRRVADLKGPGSKVNDALTELFPMFDLENVPAELLALSGWRTGLGSAQLGAEGASIGKTQLFNPDDSGYLVVCTRIDFASNVTLTWEIDTVNIPLTNAPGGENFRDTRFGVATTPVAQVRTLVDATGIPPTWQARVLANTTYSIQDDNGCFVLAPGTGVTVAPAVVNVLAFVSFFWRERLAEPSELNF